MRQILLVIGLTITLLGCGTTPLGGSPYAELEFKYSVPSRTDYWVHPDRSWQCEPPQIDVEFGLEWDKWSAGIYHESFILCGTWNEKPEIFENGLLVKRKWGGRP